MSELETKQENKSTEKTFPLQNVLEKDKRFSESVIWTWQANAFKRYAIDAWRQNIVPNYITSNSFITKNYANIVLDYLRDIVQFNTIQEPIYIVELGAGSGQFASLFMQHFYPMLEKTHLSHLKIIYVITDCINENVNYWRQHPSLQPYIESGHCDFAIFDVETDDEFHLSIANKRLNQKTLQTPLIVIANYFFDAIKHDLFYVSHQKLFESLVTLQMGSAHELNVDKTLRLDKVNFIYKNTVLDRPYYANENWNELLDYYKNATEKSYLLFPCAGLKCIDLLYNISSGHLLFLNADRGFYKLENMSKEEPFLAIHGDCFSLSVNYHALGRYVKKLGGIPLQHKSSSLTVNAFLFAKNANKYVEIVRSFEEHIINFGPNEFFQIKNCFERNIETFYLQEMELYLRLSAYDCKILYLILPRLAEELPQHDEVTQQKWLAYIRYIWSKHYMNAKHINLAYAIGYLMDRLERWDDAIAYYTYSLHYEMDDALLRFNMAFCYWKMKQMKSAVYWAKQSLELDPTLVEADKLLKRIQLGKG